jgi:hypothetical protein
VPTSAYLFNTGLPKAVQGNIHLGFVGNLYKKIYTSELNKKWYIYQENQAEQHCFCKYNTCLQQGLAYGTVSIKCTMANASKQKDLDVCSYNFSFHGSIFFFLLF